MGQQISPTAATATRRVCAHVNMLNHVLRRQPQFPQKTKGKRRILPPMGRLWLVFIACDPYLMVLLVVEGVIVRV